jgi:beta-glucosidase
MLSIILGAAFILVVALLVADSALPRRTPYARLEGEPPFGFPRGFYWGAAGADHQIENAQDDNWTAFERNAIEHKLEQCNDRGPLPGHIRHVTTTPAAWFDKKADFDRLYVTDFDHAREMGHNAHRMSLSWARLFPREDMTAPDPAAIDFYSRILDAALERKLTPFVTLFHFASPQWLWRPVDGKKGIERADAPERFLQLTEACVRAFGDRVHHWTTLNEPLVYGVLAYMDGVFPPNEQRTQSAAKPVIEAQVRMHELSYGALKADARRRGVEHQVGIAQHARSFVPQRNGSPLDRLTAWMIDRQFVWDFLDRTRATCDYVGINYYGRSYVESSAPGKFDVRHKDPGEPSEETSDLGWSIDHAGLERVLVRTQRRYGKPIYILENGIADDHDDDVQRRRFLVGQLQAVSRAISAGADVRGYFYWALTDNFEWAEGFAPRFGLLKVDYEAGCARTPRKSAQLFARIARANAIGAADWPNGGA